MNINEYLDPAFKTYEYLIEQKKKGRIRHLGFSAHGALPTMQRFLDAYGKDMEFCQIQLNWLDWDLQDAKAKVDLLNAYNIPIWVMEPVRGGALAGLDPAQEEKLKALRPHASVVEWAFRFLQSIPSVVVTLSGMSNMQQLQENIATYAKEDLLNDEERAALFQVAKAMIEKKTLPCTSCKYCVTHCPMELDIPMIIRAYNEHSYTGGGFLAPMLINSLPDEKKPAACLGCRACEGVCPQNIKISEMMADFTEKLKK